MSTGRSINHFTAALLLTLPALLFSSPCANAGCLDWLFGRPTTYTAGYPYAAPTYSAAPITGSPIPVGSPITTGTTITPVNSGVVQAQRPAYPQTLATQGAIANPQGVITTVQRFDNPSVYSGMPVNSLPVNTLPANSLPITAPTITPQPYQAYRLPITPAAQVPIASTLRGTAPQTINTLPLSGISTYTANYPAAQYPTPYSGSMNSTVAPAAYAATGYTPAVSPSQQQLPLAPRRRFGSGLARFFNSLLGRNTYYTSSYNSAPITYYRPVTTINPSTGTTVTVQQPCSSYVQQLQRVPYNSFQPLQTSPTFAQPSTGACPTTGYPIAACGTPSTFTPPPISTIQPSVIGQVGGTTMPGTYGAAPIPSTIPGGGYAPGMPLTGSSSADPSANASDPADRADVPRPELESQRPNYESSRPSAPSTNSAEKTDLYDYYDSLHPATENTGSEETGTQGTGAESSQPGRSEQQPSQDPAIKLDPPVTNQMRGRSSDPFARTQQYTSQTPPSLNSLPNTSPGNQYSTMRPIGVPSDDSRSNGSATATDVSPIQGSPTGNPPSNMTREPARMLEPPPLPSPSGRAADPSALFRNSEATASARSSSRPQVTVPIREATTRFQNIQPVAAWETVPQQQPSASPNVRTPSQSTQSTWNNLRRNAGQWMPAP